MPRCDIKELKAKLEQSEKMRDLQAEYVCKLEEKLRIAEKALHTYANLLYIQIGTKGKVNKTTRKLLKSWNLGLLHLAIEQKCEENCVHLHYVNPKYTSRTCPICGHIDKRNREGTVFKCVKCGFEDNADLNAAKNILKRFHQESSTLNNIVPDSTKASFIVFH